MPGKRKKRKLNKFRFIVFLVSLAVLFCGGFVLANNLLWPIITGEVSIDSMDDALDGDNGADLAKLDGMNVLLMGVDERTDDKSLRTDTMILANINNEDKRISLLSIPRDTKVDLPGYGTNKINAANLYGGPEMTMEVVSGLTGVPIDYYVLTNFNGFKGIVDALGGVTIDVEKDMHYHERAYGGQYNIDLDKGVQRLDGDHALQYARFRYDALGDITRTQRQLKLLTAIGQEVMQPSVVTKLPKLIPEIYKNVETNMGLKQMVAMAKAGKNIDNYQMVSQTLPGWFLNEHGASYWYVDSANAKEVARALFEEGKVVDVVKGEMSGGSSNNTQVAMDQPKKTPTVVETKPENSGVVEQSVQENQEQQMQEHEPNTDDEQNNPNDGQHNDRQGQRNHDAGADPSNNSSGTAPNNAAPGDSAPDLNTGDNQQHHVDIIISQPQ